MRQASASRGCPASSQRHRKETASFTFPRGGDSDLEPADVVPVPPFMASSTGPSTFSFNSKPVLSGFAQTNSI
jgi:hypothetical protein